MKFPLLQHHIQDAWLNDYRVHNANLLSTNAEFAAWLDNEYVPIAGGWQY